SISFPTRMRTTVATVRNISIQCDSRRGSSGGPPRLSRTRCIWICGKAILSTSNDPVDPARLSALPPLPRDEGGPVFAEPWQAQASALAVKLCDAGWVPWKEWAAALAVELRAAADRGEPDNGSRYYEHWTAALEGLVQAKGLLDEAALIERKEAWADAYRHTP